jgi:hypothetical protein
MAHRLVLVTAQVVHHHDVARTQGRHQELNHPGQKTLAIDRSVEHARGNDPVTAQARDEGQRLAITVRYFGDQPLAFGTASVQPGHVRLRPGFIDEDQSSGGDLVLVSLPLPAPTRDISAILLAGVEAFF